MTGTSPSSQVPVAEGVFTWPSDDPHLIGSRCTACGAVAFPRQSSCSRCTAEAMEDTLLDRRGTLWTWTIQGFPPPAPPYVGPVGERFEPFGVGYVELPGQVKVETRLTENDPAKLRIGMPMEMVVVPITKDDAGNDVMIFAFQPVDE